jgi:hypothetical protein
VRKTQSSAVVGAHALSGETGVGNRAYPRMRGSRSRRTGNRARGRRQSRGLARCPANEIPYVGAGANQSRPPTGVAMAARSKDHMDDRDVTRGIVSTTLGAAEALSVGVLRLTERTVVEAVRAVEEIGAELGTVVVRAARGSIKAAGDIGGDVVEVGKDISRGVAKPARQIGGDLARLATSWWPASGRPSRDARAQARKPLARASQRERRRPAA